MPDSDANTPDQELVEYIDEEFAYFINDNNLYDPETGKVNG